MLVLQRESTEYVYVGVTGSAPTGACDVAFLPAGQRPVDTDWSAATVVTDTHPLWADATSSGVAGDYYLARLVGSYGTGGVVLAPADYQMWIRVVGGAERPVRIAPVAVTVA